MTSEQPSKTPEQDAAFHTYTTHRIPWYVHVIWIGYLAGLIWYLVRYVIPSAREFL